MLREAGFARDRGRGATWPGSSGSCVGSAMTRDRLDRARRRRRGALGARARASPAAASRSFPPTASTGSPATRSTRRRSSGSTRSRAATTASPRPSSTSRRWRCASCSAASGRARARRSARCCPGPVTLVVANPERRYPLACREDPERLGVRLIGGPLAGRDVPALPDLGQPQRRARPARFDEIPRGDRRRRRPGDRRRRADRPALDRRRHRPRSRTAAAGRSSARAACSTATWPRAGLGRLCAAGALSSRGSPRKGRRTRRPGACCRARWTRRAGSAGRRSSRRRSSRAGRRR